MFYSHEILTSRKHGVATVWLVATLGAKSSTRKVTRKAITEVSIPKACSTILEPEAPMALRLQSNLMYGVTRVYSQQCGYVLSDAQAAQAALRVVGRGGEGGLDLEVGAGRGKRELLMVMDDPAFHPDMALPPLELDVGVGEAGESQRSMMSVRGRSNSVLSNSLPPMLQYSSSSGNSFGYQLPLDDPFGGSAQKPYIGEDGGENGEQLIYQDDDMFEFDAEGNIVDIPESERAARRSSVHPQGRLGSDSAASGRVRLEHAGAAGHVQEVDGDGDFNMIDYGDDPLPDAEAFPEGIFMTGGLGGNDKGFNADLNDLVYSSRVPSEDEPSSISAEAPLRKTRKPKVPKKIGKDQQIEMRNNDLLAFRDDYLANMAAAAQVKLNHKAGAQAKKNAFHFVYGTGLMNIGDGLGSLKFASPLSMFAGDVLLSIITGQAAPAKPPKRSLEGQDNEIASSPSKRARQDDEEVGRGWDDDGMPLNYEHDDPLEPSIEIGRDAPSALADYPSSALMPWNVSASLRAASSKGPGSRRMTSASPLIGRGSVLPGDLERFSLMREDDEVLYGRSLSPSLGPSSSHAQPFGSQGLNEEDEFEVFGPAANVDTQTAGTSQWVRQALDRESGNFFEYVRNTIEEKAGEGGVEGVVTFGELFEERGNTSVVAAQAFYHVLCLATKRRVWVEQEVSEEIGGEIRIGVVEAV